MTTIGSSTWKSVVVSQLTTDEFREGPEDLKVQVRGTRGVAGCCIRIAHQRIITGTVIGAADVTTNVDDVVLLGNTGDTQGPSARICCVFIRTATENGRVKLTSGTMVVACSNSIKHQYGLTSHNNRSCEGNGHTLFVGQVVMTAAVQGVNESLSVGIKRDHTLSASAFEPIVVIGRSQYLSADIEPTYRYRLLAGCNATLGHGFGRMTDQESRHQACHKSSEPPQKGGAD